MEKRQIPTKLGTPEVSDSSPVSPMVPQPAYMPAVQGSDRDQTDAALLDRVRAGDVAAYQQLLDRYWHPLLAFAARIVSDLDTAEDVVQKGFIRLWERRERWRARSAPRLILYTIVRNLALNQLESDQARTRRRSALRLVDQSAVATPAQELEERELADLLDRIVSALPPRRREALVLARFHQMTHAEIAEVMELSKRTVTNHITTALDEIEKALAGYLEE